MPIGPLGFRGLLPAQLCVLQVLDGTAKSDAPRLGSGQAALARMEIARRASSTAIAVMPTVSRFAFGISAAVNAMPERPYAISHRALAEVARVWETAMHLLSAAIAAAHPGLTLSSTNRNRLCRGFSMCWIGFHQPIIDMIRIGESLSRW
jgi:hypothetical protein